MPKSLSEWICIVVFGVLMHRLDGWSHAFQFIGQAVRPVLAAAKPEPQPKPYAKAIRAAMERRAAEHKAERRK